MEPNPAQNVPSDAEFRLDNPIKPGKELYGREEKCLGYVSPFLLALQIIRIG